MDLGDHAAEKSMVSPIEINTHRSGGSFTLPDAAPSGSFWRSSTGWSQPRADVLYGSRAIPFVCGILWTTGRICVDRRSSFHFYQVPTRWTRRGLAKKTWSPNRIQRSQKPVRKRSFAVLGLGIRPLYQSHSPLYSGIRPKIAVAGSDRRGNTQRSRPINATTLPWLFSSPKTTAKACNAAEWP